MSDDRTRTLIDEASRGSMPAVEELLTRYLPGLRAYIRLRAGPALRARESASDLAQSVCREILQNIGRFQYGGEAGFKHWLYATALRLIQNKDKFHRAQKRDVAREVRVARDSVDDSLLLAAYGSFSTPSGRLMQREELDRIEAAFDRLREDQREVIVLSRLVGLPHREIAEQMGRSEGAVRVLLHRALVRLAEFLDEEPGSDSQ